MNADERVSFRSGIKNSAATAAFSYFQAKLKYCGTFGWVRKYGPNRNFRDASKATGRTAARPTSWFRPVRLLPLLAENHSARLKGIPKAAVSRHSFSRMAEEASRNFLFLLDALCALQALLQ
jgi:hypothetical protein